MLLQYTFSPYHWIYMLVGGIVLLVANLLIAKYMHKDAIKRDIKNRILANNWVFSKCNWLTTLYFC